MADSDPTLRDIKVFPRNLTARADEIVRGNSASTRPDSGVDNCYPGLEFDQRNLDRRFFPGLRLSFHRGDGALVDEIGADFADLRDQDLPLWLWTVVGFTTQDQESPPSSRATASTGCRSGAAYMTCYPVGSPSSSDRNLESSLNRRKPRLTAWARPGATGTRAFGATQKARFPGSYLPQTGLPTSTRVGSSMTSTSRES